MRWGVNFAVDPATEGGDGKGRQAGRGFQREILLLNYL